MIPKLSFQQAWQTTTVFLVDESLEEEIDAQVAALLAVGNWLDAQSSLGLSVETLQSFLVQNQLGLDVVLKDIELSEEKFLRIVTLLRRIGWVEGEFDVEWGIDRIKTQLRRDAQFAQIIARLLLSGKHDVTLQAYIPRYYLEMLNYSEICTSSAIARQVRYKKSLIGTYAGLKGYRIEARIEEVLKGVTLRYGIPYQKGKSRMVDTNIDFAIPSLDDPWVIVMSSFQETTSSGQSTKARDMLAAYERVERSNSRYGEKRVFINFVDGGGWLARKRDFQRLVEHCHYFINLHNLEVLEDIVLQYVPKRYWFKEKL
ncbi:MAG: hypothetical protein LDL12_06895 [Anaerolinea sp.]|nr:hypothetical protein [Anaerolinea sp.]